MVNLIYLRYSCSKLVWNNKSVGIHLTKSARKCCLLFFLLKRSYAFDKVGGKGTSGKGLAVFPRNAAGVLRFS